MPFQQRHKLFWWWAGHWKNVCVISRHMHHISLCLCVQILPASAFHPHFLPAKLRTPLCSEKSHLLLWRRGCCLCCRPQLLLISFLKHIGTAILWSKFPLNLCVLRQVEIVNTWVGNAQTNTPKLRMASTSHLFLVLACVVMPTKMGREASCLFYVSEVMTALVYGRQSIVKLTAQLYFMIIAWLLIALSHTFQSVWNLLMF